MRRLAILALLVSCGHRDEGPAGPDDALDLPTKPNAASDTVPMIGGTLALSADGTLAAASDIAGDVVHLVDVAGRTPISSIQLEPGDRPGRLLVDNDGQAFVILRGGRGVASLDLLGETTSWRTDVCPSPRGLALDGNDLWVTCASGELARLDATSGAVSRSVMVEYDLRDIVIDGDDLFVSTFKKAELLTLDRDGTIVDRRKGAAFDTATLNPPPELEPFQYSSSVAWRTIPHPDGGVLMVHQRANDIEILPPPTPGSPGDPPGTYYGRDPIFPSAPRLGCTGLVHTAVTHFPKSGPPSISNIVPHAWLPTDGAMTPDGRYAVVAAAASDDVVPEAPDIVVLDDSIFELSIDCQDGETTHIPGSSQISSIAITADNTTVTVGRSPFNIFVDGQPVPVAVAEDPDPEHTAYVSVGFDLFHQDAAVGMTCAMCHPEGTEDGHTWVFPDVGVRRTQSMAGGLADTAPFHWGGEFVSFDTLVREVLGNRLGRTVIAPYEVSALTDWMEELQPVRVTPRGTSLQLGEGKILFDDPEVGCAGCHAGAQFTGNMTQDVGTGAPLQVPSLVGVGGRGPWMHDGCADTLYQRFTPECGGGDEHGKTSHLTADEISSLVTYLQSL